MSFFWDNLHELVTSLAKMLAALIVFVVWQNSRAQKKPTKDKDALKHNATACREGAAKKAQPGRWKTKTIKRVAAPRDGHIEHINPALLKESSWLLPQVVQLCQTHLPQALQLYRAALRGGLKLQELPAEDCHNLFMELVTAAIHANQTDAVQRLFDDLIQSGLDLDTSLLASTVKLYTHKKMYGECLVIFDLISKDPSFARDPSLALPDRAVWSCLLLCATEEKALEKCAYFFDHLKAGGTPLSKDFENMLRLAALKGEWQASVSLVQDMAQSNVEIDKGHCNIASATCMAAGKVSEAITLLEDMDMMDGVADAVSYNTAIKGYAEEGHIGECFEILKLFRAKGISPPQSTYATLLEACINANQVDRAAQIFADMQKSGCPLNTILYTLLIRVFAHAGDCDQAMILYNQMQAEKPILPDIITLSSLIKANCYNDHFEEACTILGDMTKSGMKPDEVVFHSLFAACAKRGNAELGKQLFADMIASGVQPSNATFSILIQLHHQSKCLGEALTLLKTAPAQYNVEPEPQLYLDLFECCVQEGQGWRAVKVYRMLAERAVTTQAMHSSVLSACIKFDTHITGAEIIQIAAAKGASVSALHTQLLLEGAVQKGDHKTVRRCAVSMQTLGHHVDPQFVAPAWAHMSEVEFRTCLRQNPAQMSVFQSQLIT